jgi:hypothetical protein
MHELRLAVQKVGEVERWSHTNDRNSQRSMDVEPILTAHSI